MAVATGTAVALAVTAGAAVMQGMAAKKQADFQATVAQQQAARANQVAAVNANDFRKQASAALATARATAAGAGVDTGSGSSLLVLEDFVAEAEVDALRIRNRGQVQADRLLQQSELLTSKGKQAQLSGFIKAGSSLLSGFSGKSFGQSPSGSPGGIDASGNASFGGRNASGKLFS